MKGCSVLCLSINYASSLKTEPFFSLRHCNDDEIKTMMCEHVQQVKPAAIYWSNINNDQWLNRAQHLLFGRRLIFAGDLFLLFLWFFVKFVWFGRFVPSKYKQIKSVLIMKIKNTFRRCYKNIFASARYQKSNNKRHVKCQMPFSHFFKILFGFYCIFDIEMGFHDQTYASISNICK